MISLSLVMLFFTSERLYSALLGFIGLNGLCVGLSLRQLKSANSLRIFGGYLLIYLLCLILIDLRGLGNELYYVVNYGQISFASRTILLTILAVFAIYYVIKGGALNRTAKSKVFIISAVILLIYILLALPIYGIHGDLGGRLHGHSYWDAYHFH